MENAPHKSKIARDELKGVGVTNVRGNSAGLKEMNRNKDNINLDK